jgi:tetratricopeptide (TPR) repeat protein
MMDQYRLGHTEDEVFQNVLHLSETQFSQEFEQWCQAKVAGWGYDDATSKQYAQLRQDGEDLIQRRQYQQAIPVWEEIARIRPVDLLPHQRLAGLYKVCQQPEKAAEQLAILASVDITNNMYAKGTARMYRDMNDPAEAARWALRAVYIDPYDAGAHQLLADLYEKLGNQPGLTRENRVMTELAHWQETVGSPDDQIPAPQPVPAQ